MNRDDDYLKISEGSLSIAPPRRPFVRWAVTAIMGLIFVAALFSIFQNERFRWELVVSYLFDGRILAGLTNTLMLTVVAMTIGVVLGIVLAIGVRSQIPTVAWAAQAYLWFFRGTPVLVQLIFWYNIGALYPTFFIGLPFMEPWLEISANDAITPLTAAILGLGLNEGAYMAEIVRAGLISVDRGQRDAAHAVGLTRTETMFRIILPQALRVIVPPTGNQTIGMLKTTSMVSVIAMADLLYAAQKIYSVNYQVIPLLVTISIWYLVLTSVLMVVQWLLENRLGRGTAQHRGGRTPRGRSPVPLTSPLDSKGDAR